MKGKFTLQGHSAPMKLHKADNSLRDILNILRIYDTDTNLAADFSQAFEVCEFQLGAQIFKYRVATPSENSAYSEQYDCGFYVVGQGRVRLLGFEVTAGQEIPHLVLEAGETLECRGFAQ